MFETYQSAELLTGGMLCTVYEPEIKGRLPLQFLHYGQLSFVHAPSDKLITERQGKASLRVVQKERVFQYNLQCRYVI